MPRFTRPLVGSLVGLSLLLSSQAFAGDVSAAGMREANEAASKVVKKRLETERPNDFAVLNSLEKADVVVVRGQYDHVETVLSSVGVPHVVISAGQLKSAALNAKQLLILNCGITLDERAIAKVRQFVNSGGFLYTTDWALSDIVQRAFPGYVASAGRKTGNDVVQIEVRKSDNPFLKHLSLSKENPRWWLESSSEPIKVLNKEKVEVLIASREMKKRYGHEPIAVTFPYGDGRVLHFASHFYMQQNQSRSVAEKKTAKDFLADDSVVPKPVQEALAAEGSLGATTGGNLSSAYAAQQMTSNLVIERKKDQARIEKIYSRTVKPGVADAKGAGRGGLGGGTKVKVLEEKGTKAKVRAMDGAETWVEKDELL